VSVPPTTVANYITEQIRAGILDGRYSSGSRLDQVSLGEEFGVSIIPVRESLRQLEAEGLVRITPRRGAFVAQPTDAEVTELYKIRGALEAFATKEAVPALQPADLAELQDLNDELIRIARSNSSGKWTRVNRAWHFKLYGVLWDRCVLTSHAYVRDPGHRVKSTDDHTKILHAACKGDAERAAELISEHVQTAFRDLVTNGALKQVPSEV
jgi:DNA-binding GntR family transcriptional regulator